MNDGQPYDLDEQSLERATELVAGLVASKVPQASASKMQGAIRGWSLPGAEVALLRDTDPGGAVTDSLVVRLLPPGPKEGSGPAGGGDEDTDDDEIDEPPPVATFEELTWTPPAAGEAPAGAPSGP
jgi:hypothetical protein